MGVVTGLPTPDDQTVVPGDGVDLVNPDLMNLHYLPEANKRYSYVFDGQAQSLDHILINQALGTDVTAYDLDHARMNADFPETNRNDADSPSRLSDHDPAIAYFAVATADHADLEMAASVSPTQVHTGGLVEFTATVTNQGPDPAANPGVGLVFDWPLPDIHSTNVPVGWTCDPPDVNSMTFVTCYASTLTTNASAQFKFAATAAVAEVPSTVDMAAAVTAPTYDPDPSNNQAQASAEVVPLQADLSISMLRTGVVTGTIANFRVPVANAGPDAAANVHVVITGNVAGSPIIAKPAGWTCQRITGGTMRIECDRAAAMPSGSRSVITFSVMVPRMQSLQFNSTASSDIADPDGTNNSAQYTRP